MITRIVKLHFKPENISSFERLFEDTRKQIREFPGCLFLQLYRDRKDPCTFFTYSRWESDEQLENYRQSDFFRKVWGQTKIMFDDRPEAWSVDVLHTLN